MLEKNEIEKIFFNLKNSGISVEKDIALWSNVERVYERAIIELQAIAFAIDFDKKLTDDEIAMLFSWFKANQHFGEVWPINDLSALFTELINTNITDQWREKALIFLRSIKTGQDVISINFDSVKSIDFTDKNVCITGAFESGHKRKTVFDKLSEIGAHPTDFFSLRVNVVIVGEKGSIAWRFTGFGRKLEDALEARKNNGTPRIVSESDFLKHYPIPLIKKNSKEDKATILNS